MGGSSILRLSEAAQGPSSGHTPPHPGRMQPASEAAGMYKEASPAGLTPWGPSWAKRTRRPSEHQADGTYPTATGPGLPPPQALSVALTPQVIQPEKDSWEGPTAPGCANDHAHALPWPVMKRPLRDTGTQRPLSPHVCSLPGSRRGLSGSGDLPTSDQREQTLHSQEPAWTTTLGRKGQGSWATSVL